MFWNNNKEMEALLAWAPGLDQMDREQILKHYSKNYLKLKEKQEKSEKLLLEALKEQEKLHEESKSMKQEAASMKQEAASLKQENKEQLDNYQKLEQESKKVVEEYNQLQKEVEQAIRQQEQTQK